jgi:hypothetical protein
MQLPVCNFQGCGMRPNVGYEHTSMSRHFPLFPCQKSSQASCGELSEVAEGSRCEAKQDPAQVADLPPVTQLGIGL